MTHKEKIHLLLYEALIQIREAAHESGDKKSFTLSNIFHNTPLKLLNATDDEDYHKIIANLRHSFEHYGITAWLDEIESRNSDR